MDRNHLESKHFGVCVKKNDGTILFQNELSKEICGDLNSKECSICAKSKPTRLRKFVNDFLFKQGFYFSKSRLIRKTPCDVVKIRDSDKEITYIHPLKKLFENLNSLVIIFFASAI